MRSRTKKHQPKSNRKRKMTRPKVTDVTMRHAIVGGLYTIPNGSLKEKHLFIRTAMATHIREDSFESFYEQVVQSNQHSTCSREETKLVDDIRTVAGTIFLNASDILLNLGLKSYPGRYDSKGNILFPRFGVSPDPTIDALYTRYMNEETDSSQPNKKQRSKNGENDAKTYRPKFSLYIKLSDLRNFLTSHKKGSWSKTSKRKQELHDKVEDDILAKDMWDFWKKYPPPGTPVPVVSTRDEIEEVLVTPETSVLDSSLLDENSNTWFDDDDDDEEETIPGLLEGDSLGLSPRAYRDKFISGDTAEYRPIPLASASSTSLDDRISIRLQTATIPRATSTPIPIHKRVIDVLIPLANRNPERFLESLPNGISLEFSCVPVDYRSTRSSYNYIVSNSNRISFDSTSVYGEGLRMNPRVEHPRKKTNVSVDGNMWLERPRDIQETWVPSMRKTPAGDLLKWDSTFADIEYRMDPGIALLRADRTAKRPGKRKQRSGEEYLVEEEEPSTFYEQSSSYSLEKEGCMPRGFYSSSDGEEDALAEMESASISHPLLRLIEEDKQKSGRQRQDQPATPARDGPFRGMSMLALREEEEEEKGAELIDDLDRLTSTKRKRQSKVTSVPNQRMYVPCISLDDLIRSGLLVSAGESLALICAKLIGLNKLKALRYLFPRLSKAEIARRREAYNLSPALTEFCSKSVKSGKTGRSKVVECIIPNHNIHDEDNEKREYERVTDGILRAICYYEFSSLQTSLDGSTNHLNDEKSRDGRADPLGFTPDDFSVESESPNERNSSLAEKSPSSLLSYYARTQQTTKSKLMQVRREFNVRRVDNLSNRTCSVDSTGAEFRPVPYVCFTSLCYSFTKQTMGNGDLRIRLPIETYTMIPIWLFPFVLRECKFDVLYEAMGSCVESITHLTDLFDSAIIRSAINGTIPLEVARECRYMLHTSARVFEYIERANVEMCLDELRSQNIQVNGCLSQICAAQKSLKEENVALRRHIEELEKRLIEFLRPNVSESSYASGHSPSSGYDKPPSRRAKKRHRRAGGRASNNEILWRVN